MFRIIKSNLQLLSGFIFLIYFLITYSNAIYINSNVEIAILFIIPIYFLTIFEFIYFYKKNGKPRLQDWFRLMLFITLVLNFMSIVNEANGSNIVSFIRQSLYLDSSYFTMLIILTALLALDFAYIIYNTFRKGKIFQDNSTYIINKKNFIFYLLILSTLFEIYLLSSGITGFGNTKGSSGLSSLLKAFSTYLTPFSILISAYILYVENNNTKIYKLIFYSMISINVIIGLLSGMKENAIEPILYIIIVILISNKKINLTYISIGLFFVLLLYPINNIYRNIISNPFTNTGSTTLNFTIAINQVMNQPLSKTLLSSSESYSDRGDMFPFLLYVTDNEYKWSYYKYMDRYIYLPISWFLPRAILTDKPKADVGGMLYAQIVGQRTNTAVTATSIGWAYLEGGIIFVFIVFLILGIIFEIINSKNLKKPLILLFYSILLHKAIKPEWDPYFMISSLIPMLIIYWTLLKIIGTTERTSNI